MRKTLKQLQDRKAVLVRDMRAILDAAAADSARAMTPEETAQYDALDADLTGVLANLRREESLQEAERTSVAAVPGVHVGHDRASNAPFASLAEQLAAIVQAGTPGQTADPRLFASASGASAAVGADGGFLIHKDFAAGLFKSAFETGVLASRCASQEVSASSDGLEVPYLNETSRATGSRWGGVRVYRVAEAATVDASKPALGKWEVRLEDMMGIAYLTERLMADAGAMAAVFDEAFREEMAFTLDDEIFRGTGVGQCLGMLNAPATVSVAKESGQLADTVVAENIIQMWGRLPTRSRNTAAWFINHEIEAQLQTMQIGTGSSAQLVYMPAGGLSGQSYGTIYGRPVLPIEHASAPGDVGDIVLADLSQYQLITKGGTQQAESMHVRFLYNERALRWTTRVNGQPRLKSAITPYKGTKTLSPFVTLAAR